MSAQFDIAADSDGGVFEVWTLREGETAELVIPHQLGYGEQGSGRSIPPYQTLVFEVELLAVK